MHQRLDGGRPLREAIRKADTTIPEVAARTKKIDPEGIGISHQLVGFYTSTGSSARETASDNTAHLITAALADLLGADPGELFAPTEG